MTPNNRNELVALLCRALDSHVGIDHEGAANAVIDAVIKAGVAFVPETSDATIGNAILLASSQHNAWDRAVSAGRIDGGGKEGA